MYRELKEEAIVVEKPPEKQHDEEFWKPLFENPIQHTENEWIHLITETNQEKPEMPEIIIFPEEIKKENETILQFQETWQG